MVPPKWKRMTDNVMIALDWASAPHPYYFCFQRLSFFSLYEALLNKRWEKSFYLVWLLLKFFRCLVRGVTQQKCWTCWLLSHDNGFHICCRKWCSAMRISSSSWDWKEVRCGKFQEFYICLEETQVLSKLCSNSFLRFFLGTQSAPIKCDILESIFIILIITNTSNQ